MIKTVNASPLISAVKGALAAITVGFTLLLLSAACLTESKGLEMITAVLPKVIQVLSAIIGGFFAGRFSDSRPYVSAAISGVFFFFIITVGSIILGGFDPMYAIINLVGVTGSSVLGSLISKEKPKSSRSRKKAIMKMIKN